MEITTIIGIVVAVIIILVGLMMVLRKPNDVTPSLESDLHINTDSNQPVIPRHVRDQLQAERVSSELQTQTRVEPNLNTLDAVDVVEDQSQKLAEVPVEKAFTDSKIEATASSEIMDAALDTQATDLEIASPTEELAVENKENVEISTQDEVTQIEIPQSVVKEKEAEFQLNPNVETAQIKEFDEESSILDVHLTAQQKSDDESSLSTAATIIALYVYPNPRKALSGEKTLKMLLKYGLRFGELSCFHRYENPEEESHLLFSVLRMTEAGPDGFDLETLSTEQVHGLAFFLALPHADVQKGFDTMVSIAGLIAREIDGTVYDENNLEFTPQLKEHWRHKAIDYRVGQEV